MKKHLPADAATVLVMRGRGNDELAPSKALFDDYKAAETGCKASTKDSSEAAWCAYKACDYARRFRTQILANPASMARLEALTEESRHRDVFLICYEGEDKPCHRKILLEIAQEAFDATIDSDPFVP